MAAISNPAMWIKNLVASEQCFAQICRSRFQKSDANGDGVLQWLELRTLALDLCANMGVDAPDEEKLRAAFDACDKNGDGVLSETEFVHFLRSFLKSALPQAEQVEVAAAERDQAVEDARQARFEAEMEQRVASYTGRLVIGTFETLAQWTGQKVSHVMVFDSLEAARQHCENKGAHGPRNLQTREVQVSAGHCGSPADAQLVTEFLKSKFSAEAWQAAASS